MRRSKRRSKRISRSSRSCPGGSYIRRTGGRAGGRAGGSEGIGGGGEGGSGGGGGVVDCLIGSEVLDFSGP